MRHALTLLTTTGLVLSAALVACSLGGGGDDDDDSSAGGATGVGGAVVSLTGGTPNGMTGGTTGTQGGSTSTNGGATSGTTGGSPNMPEACPEIPGLSECGKAAQTADIKVVNMMLVVDKSGSMKDSPTADQDSKWVMLGNALKSALGGVQEQMNLGLIMYPYDPKAGAAQANVTCSVVDGADSVNVPIGPGTTTVPDIVRIVQATTPSGGTPTAAALQAAYNYFTTGAGSMMAGNRYVLLATDGGPNCNALNTSCGGNPGLCTANLDAEARPDDELTCDRPNCCINSTTNMLRSELCLDNGAVVDAITKLKNAGVTTYVVGIPGTEIYSAYLDQFAEASGQISGGAKKFYEVTADGGVKSLTDTFTGIVTQLVHSCDIPLNPPPDDPNFVNVAIDCEIKTQDDPSAGWEIVGGNTLHLKGATCDKINTSGVKRVDLYYGCRPIQ